jgi:hypothetical protein
MPKFLTSWLILISYVGLLDNSLVGRAIVQAILRQLYQGGGPGLIPG